METRSYKEAFGAFMSVQNSAVDIVSEAEERSSGDLIPCFLQSISMMFVCLPLWTSAPAGEVHHPPMTAGLSHQDFLTQKRFPSEQALQPPFCSSLHHRELHFPSPLLPGFWDEISQWCSEDGAWEVFLPLISQYLLAETVQPHQSSHHEYSL